MPPRPNTGHHAALVSIHTRNIAVRWVRLVAFLLSTNNPVHLTPSGILVHSARLITLLLSPISLNENIVPSLASLISVVLIRARFALRNDQQALMALTRYEATLWSMLYTKYSSIRAQIIIDFLLWKFATGWRMPTVVEVSVIRETYISTRNLPGCVGPSIWAAITWKAKEELLAPQDCTVSCCVEYTTARPPMELQEAYQTLGGCMQLEWIERAPVTFQTYLFLATRLKEFSNAISCARTVQFQVAVPFTFGHCMEKLTLMRTRQLLESKIKPIISARKPPVHKIRSKEEHTRDEIMRKCELDNFVENEDFVVESTPSAKRTRLGRRKRLVAPSLPRPIATTEVNLDAATNPEQIGGFTDGYDSVDEFTNTGAFDYEDLGIVSNDRQSVASNNTQSPLTPLSEASQPVSQSATLHHQIQSTDEDSYIQLMHDEIFLDLRFLESELIVRQRRINETAASSKAIYLTLVGETWGCSSLLSGCGLIPGSKKWLFDYEPEGYQQPDEDCLQNLRWAIEDINVLGNLVTRYISRGITSTRAYLIAIFGTNLAPKEALDALLACGNGRKSFTIFPGVFITPSDWYKIASSLLECGSKSGPLWLVLLMILHCLPFSVEIVRILAGHEDIDFYLTAEKSLLHLDAQDSSAVLAAYLTLYTLIRSRNSQETNLVNIATRWLRKIVKHEKPSIQIPTETHCLFVWIVDRILDRYPHRVDPTVFVGIPSPWPELFGNQGDRQYIAASLEQLWSQACLGA